MDRYQRVEKPREESPIGANEIRITAQGRPRNYITYALALLQDNATDDIVIKAMGRAINKTVAIVELLKRRIAGLHQNTSIESIDITDTWEPLEEGLVTLETIRHVSLITIKLSKKELDTSSPGYQPPIPADQVRPAADFDQDAEAVPSGRGRGRGRRSRGRGRGRGFSSGVDYDDEIGEPEEAPRGYRGRGRGRGGRGSFAVGRGYGGDNYAMEEAGRYDDDGYNAPPMQRYG
ncbi:Alba DNA/RNA-binding protein [Zea mays]|uniref:Alba DNA/RNA-binding protein n=1 Tax=Zea mays TaxID=4577 RepID=A0A1D6EAY3_MAIZE|nr:Alba DNA/RNA-binding protein [Zea mays]